MCYSCAEGAKHIADMLKVNKSITCIDLQRNAIGDQGACELAQAMTENTTLLELALDGNDISVNEEELQCALEESQPNDHRSEIMNAMLAIKQQLLHNAERLQAQVCIHHLPFKVHARGRFVLEHFHTSPLP